MRYSKELVIGITTVATIICFVWGYNFLKGKNVFTTKRDYYAFYEHVHGCLLYTSPSPRDQRGSRMPSSA